MCVPTLHLVANNTTLPHLNPPHTKGRRLAQRNFRKNGEPTPPENPEAPFSLCIKKLHASARLTVEEAGLIAGSIKVRFFFVHQFVSVDPI